PGIVRWSPCEGAEPDLAARAPRTGAGQAVERPHARRILPRAVRGGGTIDSVSSTTRRTHRCGELRLQHVGQRVRLGGWVHRRRDLGGIVFIDLRDRAGIVQVAVGPGAPEDVRRVAGVLTTETVVEVEGQVTARPPYAVRSGVSRDRDPGPDQADPGGCARLPRAVAGTPGGVLRPAAVAPDLQATAHGVRLRPLLPAGALLPGRGSAQ